MNNKILKSLIILACIIFSMFILTNISDAASLTISTSKSSVAPGEVFTVTVTLNGGAGPVSASASNGSGSATQFLDNSSLSFSCTAGSSGSVTISASGTVGDYVTETDVSVSNSKNVSIVVPTPEKPIEKPTEKPSSNTGSSSSNTTTKPQTSTTKPQNSTTTQVVQKSSNSKLESLEIAEGVITPEFSTSVKEYEISIPNEITKLSISAIANDSKATVKISGNEELEVGDNTIEIQVTAEDGSKTTYTLLAKRAKPELSLQTLIVSYINENGEKVELLLNPEFIFNVYEYKIDNVIPHTIENLEILGTSNRENSKIEIIGNEKLKTGDNDIIIKVSVEEEDGLEEQKTYKIKLTKEEEPVIVPLTTMGKIKNWFSGIGNTISVWGAKNFSKIIIGMLLFATVSFVGLTIYFIYDYKNYKKLLAKIAEYNKANLMERVNVALDPEASNNIEEQINEENIYEEKYIKEKPEIKLGGRGKRFK